ncbi:asparagine synthase (glutamine-hydrolyzing) [Halarcobacter bivalviorum]|uniref:asparagine synthase (glutamine-hydrolyzing) n=1 Tax=Halarcobacter bivalviorum TaxID=663364 RepID=UPI00100AC66E|nr:asparagine synthase (glutamine-hydrolyzing) [Halarcobacter bivalviorum]RXK07206.1 asparagine synthase (glutamine-hydrolyzing) [Halarcobacter bivalviorum]
MCGILGSINCSNKDLFNDSLISISHRGPDNKSIYEYENILFGHTRLSIIDIENHSNQPMEDNELIIVFNGEIYNYIEIKEELKSLGYKFTTNSDTEVILKAYREWKENCVSKFNGMWAFAIFDKSTKKIFLSRDRLGVKPLYYIFKENNFIFASEIKALLPFIEERVANKNELIRYLIYGVQEHRKETMFRDIYRFPKSHNAMYDINTNILSFKKYFEIDINKNYLFNVEEQLSRLVDNSIDLRLRSDVQIGMALSGGVDSNIIVSNVHKKNPQIESFSSIYEDNDQINENNNIDITVKKLNLNQHYVLSDVDGLIKDIEHIVYIQDEPFDTLGIYAQYKVYDEMKKAGVKVSLDGQGADEIFAGYGTYRTIIMRENLFSFNFWKDYLKYYKNFLFQDIKLCLISFFPVLFEKLYFKKRASKIFTKNQKFISSKKSSFHDFKNLNKKLLNDVSEYLSVLLRYVDRNSMSKSIESRGPFLDYRVVEFALSLPSNLKYKDGFSKYILRKTFEKTVDKNIIWNKEKKGFPVPQNKWCNNVEFLKKVEVYINNSTILEELNINKNINKNDAIYWKIVNIAIWEKIYKVKI